MVTINIPKSKADVNIFNFIRINLLKSNNFVLPFLVIMIVLSALLRLSVLVKLFAFTFSSFFLFDNR